MTAPTLPYQFDNTLNSRILLLGMWGSAPIMLLVLALLHSMGDIPAETMQLLTIILPVLAVTELAAGVFLFQFSKSCTGTISRTGIEIRADRFMGITSKAAAGHYQPAQFSGVAVKQIKNNSMVFGTVTLHGKDAAPDLNLGTHKLDKANEIATLLNTELNIARA